MTHDHRMGYAPAAAEDFEAPCYWDTVDPFPFGVPNRVRDTWGDANATSCSNDVPRETPREWVGSQCMTAKDREAHEAEMQAVRLFHVEQDRMKRVPLSLCDLSVGRVGIDDAIPQGPDVISGMGAVALSRALAALKEEEEKVRQFPPMSRQAYEEDLMRMERLRSGLHREAMLAQPPPIVSKHYARMAEAASKQAMERAYACMQNLPPPMAADPSDPAECVRLCGV